MYIINIYGNAEFIDLVEINQLIDEYEKYRQI